MFPPLQVNRAIFHHCQDTGSNCGRTCAQMIISSLTQSPGPGDTFPPPAPATPITVGQDTLRLRESEPSDTVSTPQWFTHPEEMLALLKSASELTAAQRQWRLVSRASQASLIADVLHALERGLPSVIGVYPTDHWVVVTGAFFDAKGDLDILRMLNPLPTRVVAHTYIDLCSDRANGESYGPWELFDTDLGSFSLEVGTVPPSNGMKSYAGKYVGIVPGSAPTARERERLTKRIPKKKRAIKKRAFALDALEPQPLILEIQRRMATIGIEPLHRLFQAAGPPIMRVVKDLDGSPSQYTLLSLFSDQGQTGLIAAFTRTGELMHLQLTNDAEIHRSLAGDVNEPLYWTRRWLPSLPNPYFPFARRFDTNDRPIYTRVIDQLRFNPPGDAVVLTRERSS